MTGLRNVFSGFRTASSGLSAERARIDVISRNIANSRTTRMPGSTAAEPYRRQVVHFAPILRDVAGGGVQAEGVRIEKLDYDYETPFEEVYDPSHPDADVNGIVRYPNVNTMREMADLITAVRAYEANLKAQENFVRMAENALRLAQ